MPHKKSRRSQAKPDGPHGPWRIVNADPGEVVLVIPPRNTFVEYMAEVIRQARLKMGDLGIPRADSETWGAFRDEVVRAAEQYWQWGHKGKIPKVGRPDRKEPCYRAIVEVLEARAKDGRVRWGGRSFPLVRGGPKDGTPLSQYVLSRMIREREPNLDEKTCRTYAKLWRLGWKRTEHLMSGQTLISQQERVWMKKHFPNKLREWQHDEDQFHQDKELYGGVLGRKGATSQQGP